jgi:ABC-type multidrug transport system, ATPase component
MKNNLAIKIINLFKTYENVKAVNGIDLEIKKGEFYGLLGPNGAGKSTTINSITSLVKPSNGSIEIFGKNIEEDFRFARSKVGIAHQEVSQDWFFPIEQLLYFQAGFYGILRKDSKERIEYLLNKLGLFKHKSKKMRELSGGMKRRLQIAKALVHDPDIIILG